MTLVRKSIQHVIATCIFSFVGFSAAAAASVPLTPNSVLIGNGTLDTLNDLTIVQVGNNTLEFLDLTSTNGLSVNSALATYGQRGFSWASGTQVSSLLNVFGIGYAYTGGLAPFGNYGDPTSFVSYLGATYNPNASDINLRSALGFVQEPNDLLGNNMSYVCVGTSCGGGSTTGFVLTTGSAYGINGAPAIGVFLVREGIIPSVPEPETFAILLPGLGLISAVTKRRKHKQA